MREAQNQSEWGAMGEYSSGLEQAGDDDDYKAFGGLNVHVRFYIFDSYLRIESVKMLPFYQFLVITLLALVDAVKGRPSLEQTVSLLQSHLNSVTICIQ